MTSRRILSLVLLGGTLAAGAACHDGTAPGSRAPSIDTRTAQSRVEPLAAVFDEPEFASFGAALRHFPSFLGPTSPPPAAAKLDVGGLDAGMLRSLAPAAGILATAIPADVKGKTFVYDLTARMYVADASAVGAPATGLRIVLYAIDAQTGQVVSPLHRLGYADIAAIAPSTTAVELLQLRVVRDAGSAVLADFVSSHSTNATGGGETFGIDGTASNGATTVDVGLNGSVVGSLGTPRTFLFDSRLSARGTVARMQLSFDQSTVTFGEKLSIAYDDHTLTWDTVNSDVSGADIEVRFDGNLYVTISSRPESGSDGRSRYLKPDGSSLTDQEIAALYAVTGPAATADFYWIDLVWR